MADNWAVKGVSRDGEQVQPGQSAADQQPTSPSEPVAPRMAPSNLVAFAVGVIGLAALGATAWVYAETQREIRRVSSDIAQIRVSLELFGRQQSTGAGTASSDAGLLDLSNRLALLEANQRNGSAAGAVSALPVLPSEAATGGTVASGGDCLPVGTRFMVAAGDSYPVCGTTGTVAIASVDEGYITLSDGTIIAQGGTVGLPNTKCMIGVVPSEGNDISGFAEIRVVC